jgi:hypothetical protein
MYYLGVRAGFTLNLFSEKEKRMPLQSLTQPIKRIFKLITFHYIDVLTIVQRFKQLLWRLLRRSGSFFCLINHKAIGKKTMVDSSKGPKGTPYESQFVTCKNAQILNLIFIVRHTNCVNNTLSKCY